MLSLVSGGTDLQNSLSNQNKRQILTNTCQLLEGWVWGIGFFGGKKNSFPILLSYLSAKRNELEGKGITCHTAPQAASWLISQVFRWHLLNAVSAQERGATRRSNAFFLLCPHLMKKERLLVITF